MAGIQQPVLNWHRPTQPWKTSEKSTTCLCEGVNASWPAAQHIDTLHSCYQSVFDLVIWSEQWSRALSHNLVSLQRVDNSVKPHKIGIVSENLPSQANCLSVSTLIRFTQLLDCYVSNQGSVWRASPPSHLSSSDCTKTSWLKAFHFFRVIFLANILPWGGIAKDGHNCCPKCLLSSRQVGGKLSWIIQQQHNFQQSWWCFK